MTEVFLRSLLASALGIVVLLLARRASASVRHLIAVAALAATLAVIVFAAILPATQLPVLPAPPAAPEAQMTSVPVQTVVFPTPTVAPAIVEAPASPFPWFLIWPAVSMLLALRLLAGWLWLIHLLRSAKRISGFDLDVPVLESGHFRTPITAWIGRPVVVLPVGWREWPEEQVDIVLRHERGHLQRVDGWAMLLARCACIAAWPNPLVWWLARAENVLAEQATDDLVVGEGIAPWRYADVLFAIAQEASASPSLPILGTARKAEVAQRVEMILNAKVSRKIVSRKFRPLILLAALLAAVPVATWALAPQTQGEKGQQEFSATLATAAPSPDFLLRCKLVKRKAVWSMSYVDSMTEPQIGQSDPKRVVAIPHAVTANGVPVSLDVKYDKVRMRVSLTPYTDLLNPPSLKVESVVPYKGVGLSFNRSEFRVRPSAWVRYSLADLQNIGTSREVTAHGDYELLVQMIPLRPLHPYRGAIAVPAAQAPVAPVVPQRVVRGQILLKCKVVSSGDPVRDPFSKSATEPVVSKDATRLVASPTVRTLSGQERDLLLDIDGTKVGVRFQTTRQKSGAHKLNMRWGALVGGKWRKSASGAALLKRDEWVRFRLWDIDGNYLGHEMLVQLVPVK